jgi:hypothetical protein
MGNNLRGWFKTLETGGGIVTNSDITGGKIVVPITPTPPSPVIIPPGVTGFTVYGGFATIICSWDAVVMASNYFAYCELWRSQTNLLSTAVLIGSTIANIYVDSPPLASLSQTYYYWIRAVSSSGGIGPFNSTEGTPGSTASDPAYLLELLTDQITASQLYIDLNSRIDLIDNPTTGLVTKMTQVGESISVMQSQISALTVTPYVAGQSGTVGELVSYNGNTYRCILAYTAPPEHLPTNATYWTVTDNSASLSAAIITETNTRAAADTAMASQITTMQATIGASTASIQSLQSVTATMSGPVYNPGSIYTLNAVVQYAGLLYQNKTGHSLGPEVWNASHWTRISVNLYAEYMIKTDVNGYIAGFGLSNDGTTSQFLILANRFAVVYPGKAAVVPFVVDSVQGVVMDGAYIKNLTVTDAHIRTVTTDKIVAGTALIGTALIADGTITTAKIASVIYSTNWSQGNSGWYIGKSGVFEFNGGTFRGIVQVGTNGVYTDLNNWVRPGSSLINGNKIYTGDAYVDTLQIRGQAITIPVSAYTAGTATFSFYSSGGIAQTAVMDGAIRDSGGNATAESFPVIAMISIGIQSSGALTPGAGSICYVWVERNGTALYTSANLIAVVGSNLAGDIYGVPRQTVSLIITDDHPPTSSNTYTIRIQQYQVETTVFARNISLIGAKR